MICSTTLFVTSNMNDKLNIVGDAMKVARLKGRANASFVTTDSNAKKVESQIRSLGFSTKLTYICPDSRFEGQNEYDITYWRY